MTIRCHAPRGAGRRPASSPPRPGSLDSRRIFIPIQTFQFFRSKLRRASWVTFAVQLHHRQVRALMSGSPVVEATIEGLASEANISKRSAWSAMRRLRELGWVQTPRPGLLVFDYRRTAGPSSSASRENFADALNRKRKPSGKDEITHPSGPTGSASPHLHVLEAPSVDKAPSARKEPSFISNALELLLQAGVDRAGAVVALKRAMMAYTPDLELVRNLIAAVETAPAPFKNKAGLLCALLAQPDLGRAFLWAPSRHRASRASKAVSDTKRPAPTSAELIHHLRHLQRYRPLDSSPDYSDHLKSEREARVCLVALLERELPGLDHRRVDLELKLEGLGMTRGSLVWAHAWGWHWSELLISLATS